MAEENENSPHNKYLQEYINDLMSLRARLPMCCPQVPVRAQSSIRNDVRFPCWHHGGYQRRQVHPSTVDDGSRNKIRNKRNQQTSCGTKRKSYLHVEGGWARWGMRVTMGKMRWGFLKLCLWNTLLGEANLEVISFEHSLRIGRLRQSDLLDKVLLKVYNI